MNHEVNNTELMPMATEPTNTKHKNILSFQEFTAGGSSDTENLPVPAQPMNGPANPGMDLTFMDEPATQDTEPATQDTETVPAPEETETEETGTEDSQNMDQAV